MSFEQKEKVLVEVIKDDIDQLIFDESKPLSADAINILSSLITVLQYHMWREDFDEWFDSRKGLADAAMKVNTDNQKEISALEMIREHADGSATYEYEVSADMKETLINEGFNSMLIRGILGIGLDDLLRLATLGQQVEKLDG